VWNQKQNYSVEAFFPCPWVLGSGSYPRVSNPPYSHFPPSVHVRVERPIEFVFFFRSPWNPRFSYRPFSLLFPFLRFSSDPSVARPIFHLPSFLFFSCGRIPQLSLSFFEADSSSRKDRTHAFCSEISFLLSYNCVELLPCLCPSLASIAVLLPPFPPSPHVWSWPFYSPPAP